MRGLPVFQLNTASRRLSWMVWPIALVVTQQLLFPAPAGSFVSGLVLGSITSLVAVAMYLVYRANNVLNFAAGELGLLPAVFATLLVLESGWRMVSIGPPSDLMVCLSLSYLFRLVV